MTAPGSRDPDAGPGAAAADPAAGDRRRWEPPFRLGRWSASLVAMVALGTALWVVQIVNAGEHQGLDRFGLRPRRVDGLWGVLTQAALHPGYGQLLSVTAPFIALGWLLLLSGPRAWFVVTSSVVLIGGALTWLVAPSGLILGADSLVFGWLGYLVARAWFARRVLWIAAALVTLFFFGTLLSGLLPSESSTDWPAHLCGFGVGVLTGALLHGRRGPAAGVTRNASNGSG